MAKQYMTTTNHHSMELPQASTWTLQGKMGGADYQHHHHHYYNHYYPQHHHQEEEEEQMRHQREHLFEKPLTPSDVGKLNRLVIPKQHAEMHFPLDGESGDKGLLLGFEDESGKAWRFRYSYWTSSQSYVLTKGWSRFVKEKRLDAGDIVLFERRRSDADRLYIGWKRRGDLAVAAATKTTTTTTTKHRNNAHAVPWNPVPFGTHQAYPHNPSANYSFTNGAVQQDYEVSEVGMQDKTAIVPVASSTATTNSKRLRLFGVNLECGFVDVAESPDTMAMHDGIDPRELQLLPCNGFSSSES